jgi:hypothetical protein
MVSVLSELASIWEMGSPGGQSAPSEYRASQMTFVLHFGFDHTRESARETFDTVLRFAQRYPCRVVVLCPRMEEGEEDVLRSKVFGECYIGNSREEMSCCEAIIVSYPNSQRGFLENQVTTLVETDLPLYYWPSRVHDGAKLADYGFFLNHSKRIVIDTAVENSSVPEFAWPRPENLSDLAEARILQVRQSLGQFLSTFDPALLVERLEKVSVTAAPALAAETGYMLDWTLNNLSTCGQRAGLAGEGAVRSEKNLDGGEESIRMEWFYGDQKAFSWAVDFASGRARIKATFKGEPIRRDSIVRLLGPEQALGEALFF